MAASVTRPPGNAHLGSIPSQHAQKSHAFTVDVEDGISIAMRDVFGIPAAQTSRVETNTIKILELLARHHAKATFFLLGQVAEEFPRLVKQIDDEGHELGVHGYAHLRFDRISPAEARSELLTAKTRIEQLVGRPVLGHRAPAFSITPKTAWAFDIIAECGFQYDSSVTPTRTRGGGGWPGFGSGLVEVQTPGGRSVLEVPLSTMRIVGLRVQFLGGSFLRLMPLALTRRGMVQNKTGDPQVLYLHPYEFDTDPYPREYLEAMKRASFWTRMMMRSYWYGRRGMQGKVDQLLSILPFTTLAEVVDNYRGRCAVGQFGLE